MTQEVAGLAPELKGAKKGQGQAPVLSASELLPPKYSDDKATELKHDVQAGPQTKNFDLTK